MFFIFAAYQTDRVGKKQRTNLNPIDSSFQYFCYVYSVQSLEHGEKEDVYQLGLILFEIITGKPAGSQREVEALKAEVCSYSLQD